MLDDDRSVEEITMTGQQRKALGDDRGVEEMTRSSDVYPRVLRFQTPFKRNYTKGHDTCYLLGFVRLVPHIRKLGLLLNSREEMKK